MNIPRLKLGNIRVIFTTITNRACYEKYLKGDKHNSIHLVWNYAQIFVLGENLFLKPIPQLRLRNTWKLRVVQKNIWRIINAIAFIWLLKYAPIFVLGHYLFLKARRFPRATLSENCSLLGTDNVRNKYPSIFPRQMEAIYIVPVRGKCPDGEYSFVKISL